MNRHLILVGISGSGKTTVGKRVAERLGVRFADIDEMVTGQAGISIADVFRTHGEAEFRRLERAAVDKALHAAPQVISPGAGWSAEPGNLESARRETRLRGAQAMVLYLRVSPETAAARLTGDTSRPLLAGPDSAGKIAELLGLRELWYRQSDAEVEASGTVEEVAERVMDLYLNS